MSVSLVSQLNEAQTLGPESVGVRMCDPEVPAYLLRSPDLRGPLRDLLTAIRAVFPEGEIRVELDTDPDDARKSIGVRVLVPGLDRARRLAFYQSIGEAIPIHLAGRLVVGVERG